ncbi:MAG: hypothetical protein ACM3WV_08890 [Bacillota bacterium]
MVRKKTLMIWIVLLPAAAAGIWAGVSGIFRGQDFTLSEDEAVWGRMGVEITGPFTIGDHIPVFVEAEAGRGVSFELPDLAGALPSGNLEIVRKTPVERQTFPKGRRLTARYVLTAWRTGKHALPNLTVDYRDGSGRSGSYQIPGQAVTVVSVLPAGKNGAVLKGLGIKGIKGPAALPPQYPFLYGYLLVSASAGILILLRTAWKKRHGAAGPEEEEPPPEPAHLIALRRLAAIKEAGYLEKGDDLAFYTALSECLRAYMEDRCRIKALEMTTEEFLAYMNAGDYFTGEQQKMLREFLSASDLVKFAKRRATLGEAVKALQDVERFILETAEEQPPTPETGGVKPDVEVAV